MAVTAVEETKALERFILLVLGAASRRISLLHLEKEVFLLWNFHPYIRKYIQFVRHYRGPYSSEIRETIEHPFYLTGLWQITHRRRGDGISGGDITLTSDGRNEYERLYSVLLQHSQMRDLLTGIRIVRDVYDEFDEEELLLLFYNTYPDYREYSEVAIPIYKKRQEIADRMLKKNLIDIDRYNDLVLEEVWSQ